MANHLVFVPVGLHSNVPKTQVFIKYSKVTHMPYKMSLPNIGSGDGDEIVATYRE